MACIRLVLQNRCIKRHEPKYMVPQKVYFIVRCIHICQRSGKDSCPGPSCSKLTMSLVNVSLKIWSLNMVYIVIFLLKKNVSSFCICKSYSHFFSQNTGVLDIVFTRSVNILTTNELVKLTMPWTTGPRMLTSEMKESLVTNSCALLTHFNLETPKWLFSNNEDPDQTSRYASPLFVNSLVIFIRDIYIT